MNSPAPAAADSFGWSSGISGNLAVVGAIYADPGGMMEAGIAYVFNASTGAVAATLNNPTPAEGEEFGWAVAISGNLALVGAYGDDPGGIVDAGTAYVFDATTGALVTTLNNPVPSAGDAYGWAVAISGNLAVVGAWGDNPGGLVAVGTAYVFNASTGALMATLNNPEPAFLDRLGVSVGISGNLVVASAHSDDPGGAIDAGTAYIFDATTGALVATLVNPSPAASDFFGYSVGISGNVAVVGAPYSDPGGVQSAGSVYVFNATTGALAATLVDPAPTTNGYFGEAAAVSGSVALAGARGDNPGGVQSAGAAYAFDVSTGALLATLSNPAPTTFDEFGQSVAISGGVAVVGAIGENPGGLVSAGSAYTFACPTPLPPRVFNPPRRQNANLGQDVAFHVEADGAGIVLASMPKQTFNYQWLKDGAELPGETGDTLMLQDLPATAEGNYQCQVTGAGGSSLSENARLTVFDPPRPNAAELAGDSAPATMYPDQALLVGIVMKNTSELTWSPTQGYALAVVENEALFENAQRLGFYDPYAVIPDGNGVFTFVGALRAPGVPGVYSAKLRMVEENVEQFGPTVDVTIEVVPRPNAAAEWEEYQ